MKNDDEALIRALKNEVKFLRDFINGLKESKMPLEELDSVDFVLKRTSTKDFYKNDFLVTIMKFLYEYQVERYGDEAIFRVGWKTL